jgi:hypothetical protein
MCHDTAPNFKANPTAALPGQEQTMHADMNQQLELHPANTKILRGPVAA